MLKRDEYIKKLVYQSSYRGCREMDRILGGFSRRYLKGLDHNELIKYEELLEVSDPELFSWLTGKVAVPKEFSHSVTAKLLEYIE